MRLVLRRILIGLLWLAGIAFGLFTAAIFSGDTRAAGIEFPHEPTGQEATLPAIVIERLNKNLEANVDDVQPHIDECKRQAEAVFYNRGHVYLTCLNNRLEPIGYQAAILTPEGLVVLHVTKEILLPSIE